MNDIYKKYVIPETVPVQNGCACRLRCRVNQICGSMAAVGAVKEL